MLNLIRRSNLDDGPARSMNIEQHPASSASREVLEDNSLKIEKLRNARGYRDSGWFCFSCGIFLFLFAAALALYDGHATGVEYLTVAGIMFFYGIVLIFEGSHKLKSLPKKGSSEWDESSPKRYSPVTIFLAIIFSLGIGIYVAQRYLIY